jgi:iron complex transport system substrate-binding protein
MQVWKRASSILLCAALMAFGAPALLAGAPKRIVSVAPAFTEILFALGLGNEVVGTTSYCDYPPAARDTEKIGDSMTPNAEKIVALRPDMVFCGAYKWNLPGKLRGAGLRVVEVPDATDLKDILQNILLIGREAGRERQALDLVDRMKAVMDQVRRRYATSSSRTRVYLEIDAGNWTIGRTSYINEALEVAGLRNIFSDRKEPYLLVSLEAIVSRRPDLILSTARTSSNFRSNAAWSAVAAVQKERILGKEAMDWNTIARPGPRIAEGIERLAELARRAMQNRRLEQRMED